MEEVNRVRAAVADTESVAIAQIALAVAERLERGGKLIAFGNGGSATDVRLPTRTTWLQTLWRWRRASIYHVLRGLVEELVSQRR